MTDVPLFHTYIEAIPAIADFLAESNRIEGYNIDPIVYQAVLRQNDVLFETVCREYTDFDLRLVKNSVAAFNQIILWRDKKISMPKIKAVHKILMNGLMENPDWEGKFKPSNIHVTVGGRLTPTGEEMKHILKKFISRFNSLATDDDYILETHFWYEYAHPFCDGNGRTGRLFWLWNVLQAHPLILAKGIQLRFLQEFDEGEPLPPSYWSMNGYFDALRFKYYGYLRSKSTSALIQETLLKYEPEIFSSSRR